VERSIVTIAVAGEPGDIDVEVSANMPGEALATAIAEALGWETGRSSMPVTYDIELLGAGRRLRPDETLAQAEAWDGSRLIFHPLSLKPPLPEPSVDLERQRLDWPVAEWQPLSGAPPPSRGANDQPAPASSRFWNREEDA